ncbi:MAG TPA: glycosyltransferase [Candidatus Saccharimonadales bacterium]|nr:glycosyltransferase [Candidatus Saccharimonadales bacterium]
MNSSWPPVACGVGDYTAKLAQELVRLGCRIEVMTSAQFPVRAGDYAGVMIRPVITRWHRRNFIQLIAPIARMLPRYVIFQYPSKLPGPVSSLTTWGPVFARFFFPFTKVVMIVHEYTNTLAANKSALNRALKCARVVIGFNPTDVTAIRSTGVSRVYLTRVGSNIAKIPNQPVKTPTPYIVFFGLQQADKGIRELFEALRRAPGVGLVMIGAINREFMSLSKQLAVEPRIEWAGLLDEDKVSSYLQNAEAAVFPFYSGMRPNSGSVLAAFANNCPVITTCGHNTPDYIRESPAVTIVPPKDSAALSQAIMAHLKSDVRTRQKEELQKLAECVSWTPIAREFLDLLAGKP